MNDIVGGDTETSNDSVDIKKLLPVSNKLSKKLVTPTKPSRSSIMQAPVASHVMSSLMQTMKNA